MSPEMIGLRVNRLSMFKVGNGQYGYLQFEYRGVLTKEEAAKIQRDRGYHPAGYDFFGYHQQDGLTQWRCSTSCD